MIIVDYHTGSAGTRLLGWIQFTVQFVWHFANIPRHITISRVIPLLILPVSFDHQSSQVRTCVDESCRRGQRPSHRITLAQLPYCSFPQGNLCCNIVYIAHVFLGEISKASSKNYSSYVGTSIIAIIRGICFSFWFLILKRNLNTDTLPQELWPIFLGNDLTDRKKRSTLYFSFFLFCYAVSCKNEPNHFFFISFALVTLLVVLG